MAQTSTCFSRHRMGGILPAADHEQRFRGRSALSPSTPYVKLNIAGGLRQLLSGAEPVIAAVGG